MNREIKFRLWDKEDQKMHYPSGNWYYDCEYASIHFPINDKNFMGYRNKDSAVLMQYTGLKDKNEIEIYEGDVFDLGYIVTYVDGSDKSNLGLDVGFYIQRDNFESLATLEIGLEYEILGNIYENPEILKNQNPHK